MKDWTGNGNSIYKTLGASNHTDEERENNDYYATDPIAAKLLLDLVDLNQNIWEPSCGEGHLSKVFVENNFTVKSSDLIDRGYGETGIDFLTYSNQENFFDGDIVTNPPYKYAKEFVEKSLQYVKPGNKVCMFLKLTFLEGKARKKFFEQNNIHTVFVSSSRITCAKNGDFQKMKESGGSAAAYAWFIWEKGYKGETTLKFFN
jgi:hypothetical protein